MSIFSWLFSNHTVDSIVAPLKDIADQLFTHANLKQEQASTHDMDAFELKAKADTARKESERAHAVAKKIADLVSVV